MTTLNASKKHVSLESLAGMALIGAAALGMLFANTPLAEWYQSFLSVVFEIRVGDVGLAKPLLLWINDGLMAVFFLIVALELKREILDGELSSWSQVALPLAASIGGIAVPALIFVAINQGDPEALRGWAIPAATDIAFALGILAMLGDRIPKSLKTFLLSLAVFDDLGAILIIAAFYTEEISWLAKGLGLGVTAVLFVLNRRGVTRIGPYLFLGAILWVCVLKSGVHATVAGVIVGLMIPHRRENRDGRSPLLDLEHALHPWVSFLIVPVFAFANSGVSLAGFSEGILDPVALGIVAGLFFGKMLGIFSVASLMIRTGVARLPSGSNWGAMFGVCVLAGIGFTMSLFIGTLAFEHAERDFGVPLRLGVLGGSLLSATLGFLLLRRSTPSASSMEEPKSPPPTGAA